MAAWWRHQMEAFSALLAICAGNSPVSGEFPTQRPVTRSFDVFFDLRLNKRLSKQWWSWWFETPSPPLWRHRNELHSTDTVGCNYWSLPLIHGSGTQVFNWSNVNLFTIFWQKPDPYFQIQPTNILWVETIHIMLFPMKRGWPYVLRSDVRSQNLYV